MKKIKAYNSLSKKKEIIEPKNPPHLNIYTCGPTVYDHSHIGHARSAITWDFIIRFLKYMGYKVIWTRNITDIDDKIINKSKELNLHPNKVAGMYTYSFYEDMISLNIDWPDFEPHATQYLNEMHEFIKGLIKKGNAYEINNDVYFLISSYKKYGQLKGQTINELEKGFGRIEPNEKKKHPLDFAMWKAVKEKNEFGFDSPWGKGRPGWHLECSCMCDAIYQTNLDIHGGGEDLIFPHHENEIAQSESLFNTSFANYWFHHGMIMVDGKKMAKSEGNFVIVKDALKNISANALRLFILNTHYRMPLNYTNEAIKAAQNGVYRLQEALIDYKEPAQLKPENEWAKEFQEVMSDDFNSPQALSVLFKLADIINTEKNKDKKEELQGTLFFLSNILGFNLQEKPIHDGSIKDRSLARLVDLLILWRNDCKKNKDYKNADKIRQILNNSNIEVQDLSEDKYKWQIKY